MSDDVIITLTADIVSAHLTHNNVATGDVPGLIRSVFAALRKTAESPVEAPPKQEPAVSIRASVKSDHIICLEDGAKLKMLKRYLRTRFNMSPEDYRTKWGLPRDYPMVAPAYAEKRREMAHTLGLGRRKAAVDGGVSNSRVRLPAKNAEPSVDGNVARADRSSKTEFETTK